MMFPPIFAISETVQLALVQNFVPIVTVLISAGGAIVSWMGWKKAQSNSTGINDVKEVVTSTSKEAKDAVDEAKVSVEKATETTAQIQATLDAKFDLALQQAVDTMRVQLDLKHDKEVADLRRQIFEAQVTGDRRKPEQCPPPTSQPS